VGWSREWGERSPYRKRQGEGRRREEKVARSEERRARSKRREYEGIRK
jgi:hypothetical protein